MPTALLTRSDGPVSQMSRRPGCDTAIFLGVSAIGFGHPTPALNVDFLLLAGPQRSTYSRHRDLDVHPRRNRTRRRSCRARYLRRLPSRQRPETARDCFCTGCFDRNHLPRRDLPTVAIEIAPCRREAEAVVVFIQATLFSDVLKHATIGRQSIFEQKVRGAIARILIGGGELILILALEIDVTTEIQIQAAVAIIIRRRHSCERTLRLGFEPERIRMFPESPVASIEEKQRPGRPKDNQILMDPEFFRSINNAQGVLITELQRRLGPLYLPQSHLDGSDTSGSGDRRPWQT